MDTSEFLTCVQMTVVILLPGYTRCHHWPVADLATGQVYRPANIGLELKGNIGQKRHGRPCQARLQISADGSNNATGSTSSLSTLNAPTASTHVYSSSAAVSAQI